MSLTKSVNPCVLYWEFYKYCHRYDFWYVFIGKDFIFFQTFQTFISSFGIDHDPHVLYVHMIHVYSFLMFLSSHDHMAKRSHYRIMIFLRLRSTNLRTHPHPHFLLPPHTHHHGIPRPHRSMKAPLGEGYHPAAKYAQAEDPDCT